MVKKRLSLSLVALIGSVFLFVAASFAWFAGISFLAPMYLQAALVCLGGATLAVGLVRSVIAVNTCGAAPDETPWELGGE